LWSTNDFTPIGVGFRFEEIRSLFYSEFLLHNEDEAGDDVPDLHHLTQNFRTHSGVCDIASSVVDLTVRFFPNSIDKLKKEEALVKGELPVHLKIEGFEQFCVHLFGKGKMSQVEFGAEQVILVRDQAAKEKILSKIRSGLVLTIYESKGLEFKVVMLYNFWTDSPAFKLWRVIYQYMVENNLGRPPKYPAFSVEKHSILSSELKQLYVGVTRARQDLFFFDESAELCKPMFDYWESRKLVRTVTSIGDPSISSLARKGDPETWKRQGNNFFNNRNYELARHCFINGNDTADVLWCEAAIIRTEASSLEKARKPEAYQKYIAAAEKFIEVQKEKEMQNKNTDVKCYLYAARCYHRGRSFEKAAEIYYESKEFKEAGNNYRLAHMLKNAAHSYLQIDMMVEALDCFEALQLFKKGLLAISDHRKNGKNESKETKRCIEKFIKHGALYYHTGKNETKMMAFVHQMESEAKICKFLERYGYVQQLVDFFVAQGNFGKAGGILLANERFTEAAEAFGKANQPIRAAECLLEQAKALFYMKLEKKRNAQVFVPSTQTLSSQFGSLQFSSPSTSGTAMVAKPTDPSTILSKRAQRKAQQELANEQQEVPPPAPPLITVPAPTQEATTSPISSSVPAVGISTAEKLLLEVKERMSSANLHDFHAEAVLFETHKLLALIQGNVDVLASLASEAQKKERSADELEILLRLVPIVTHLVDDGDQLNAAQILFGYVDRLRQLVFLMIEVLRRIELNHPYDRAMVQVEKFFQLYVHPNSEYKYLKRFDWLETIDYQDFICTKILL
jgi:tetratricopeptide (TPR) repeat protein